MIARHEEGRCLSYRYRIELVFHCLNREGPRSNVPMPFTSWQPRFVPGPQERRNPQVPPLVAHTPLSLPSDGVRTLRTLAAGEDRAPLQFTDIDEQVLRLFAMVSEGLAAATKAFLADDRDAAREVVAAEQNIDSLEAAIECLVVEHLDALSVHASSALPMFVAVLRIVPELERSGDLVEHIALRTPQGMAQILTPRARGLIEQMGQTGVDMWRQAANAYAARDATAAERLRRLDDWLDELHVNLSTELGETLTSTAVAIEMGLVARFLERLGDHAVNVCRRLQDVCVDPA
jgi:phosphate transport system protein